MSEKNNYSELFRLLAGAPEPLTRNPFAPDSSFLAPKSAPKGSLAAMMGALAGPAKPKPPDLSVEHMKGLIDQSLSKKLDVNPGRQLPTIFDLAIGEGRQLN